MIPFNKPYISGHELSYIRDAVSQMKLSGNGTYTKKCHNFFENRYGFKKCLLTTSCTDALEMAAILIGIKPGDEVIVPAYTFVSTANAFVLRGAKIIFADSRKDHPGIDEDSLASLITSKTKAIVPVHYAGVACDMDKIMRIAETHNLFVIEDAAQAIDSFYKNKPLGIKGHLSTFSFHETKNIIAGEGGMLVINDEKLMNRSEIIWEKGTDRAAFWRGEVDKYGWVDIGSSFLPSELTAAFLWGQLENLDQIQTKRKMLWQSYFDGISKIENKPFKLPSVPEYASNNAHMFYLVLETSIARDKMIALLKEEGVNAVFHYQSLQNSRFYDTTVGKYDLEMADMFTECLIRLPFFYEMTEEEVMKVVKVINNIVINKKLLQ